MIKHCSLNIQRFLVIKTVLHKEGIMFSISIEFQLQWIASKRKGKKDHMRYLLVSFN